MAALKADSMAAWTVASRVESWAECWAVPKADYLAASKVALMVHSTVASKAALMAVLTVVLKVD